MSKIVVSCCPCYLTRFPSNFHLPWSPGTTTWVQCIEHLKFECAKPPGIAFFNLSFFFFLKGTLSFSFVKGTRWCCPQVSGALAGHIFLLGTPNITRNYNLTQVYSLRPNLFVVFGFRATSLTRFIENISNICISK